MKKMNEFVKNHRQTIAMWCSIGNIAATVVLTLVLHDFVFDELRWAVRFDVWDMSFWGIAVPFFLYLIENMVYLFFDKGLFKRTESYWINLCNQLLFAIIVPFGIMMLATVLMVALGIYCGVPAHEVVFEILGVLMYFLAETLPYMLLVSVFALPMSIPDWEIHILRFGGKNYIILKEIELDGTTFYLLVPRYRWKRRALMFRKLEIKEDGEYISHLNKQEFILCYSHMKSYIEGYLQNKKVTRVS